MLYVLFVAIELLITRVNAMPISPAISTQAIAHPLVARAPARIAVPSAKFSNFQPTSRIVRFESAGKVKAVRPVTQLAQDSESKPPPKTAKTPPRQRTLRQKAEKVMQDISDGLDDVANKLFPPEPQMIPVPIPVEKPRYPNHPNW